MGDFNADMTDKKFAEFVTANNLIDIVADTNPGDPPRTYARGTKRLDYILCDHRIRQAVIKSGSLALHDGIFSDHTMQWVDFDQDILFGDEAVDRVPPPSRQFTMMQARKKKDFQDKLEKLNEEHNVEARVLQLEKDFGRLRNAELDSKEMVELIRRYHGLDELIMNNMIKAANEVGRTDFGYQRSDELVQAGRLVTFWKTVASCMRRGSGFTDRLHKLATNMGIDQREYMSISQKQARRMAHRARTAKKEIHKRDGEARASWLEEHAKAHAEDDPQGTDWKTILTRMIAAARQRIMQRRITRIFKPEHVPLDYIQIPVGTWFYDGNNDELYEFDRGLFRAHPRLRGGPEWTFSKASSLKTIPEDVKVVEVDEHDDMIQCLTTQPTEAPKWQNVTDSKEIEKWLAKRNKRHYQQVWQEKAYPTQEPLIEILGEHGTTQEVEDLLEGDFDIDALDVPDYVKEWLKWMELTPAERALKPIPPKITPEAFAEAFKVTDEMTSSSPSHLHYTLWKAVAEKEKFCKYYAVMMSLPFEYGFSNKRWENAIDCMLEKKLGIRKIHLMRIIGLLEADFNTALKILFAGRMMCNAEIAGISSSQWGGRANRSAIACATRKLIAWEYARYTKTTLVSFFCDLAGNFDRMLVPISNVVAQKKGMAKTVCECRSRVMTAMRRTIRTAAGTSKLMYQWCKGETRTAGEIQGKGDVMALWALQSDGALEVHNKLTKGVTLQDVNGREVSNRSADAYVDDADVYETGPNSERIIDGDNGPPEDDSDDPAAIAILETEASAQLYTCLMECLGQHMAFHKCKFQVLAWKSKNGKMVPRDNDEMNGSIKLKDNQGVEATIAQLSYKKPNIGLGCRLTPLGDQDAEFKHRLAQAKTCAAAMGPVALSHFEAYISYVTRILPKITFPFALTRFTKKQLHKLAIIVDNVVLPKMGINRHTPRAVVYGPRELGGIGYPYIGTIQDKRGIAHFVRQIQWGKELATELRILTSHAQLCSGIMQPILEQPQQDLPHLEEGYIAHIHKRLKDLGGGIWIENAWTPSLQREGDKSLMEEFMKVTCKGASKNKLIMTNQVRMWLRVITIAELAEEGGLRIPPHRLQGLWRAKSSLKWPNLPKPTKKMWQAFRFYLRKSICKRKKRVLAIQAMPLDTPLGPWYSDATRHVTYDKYRTLEWMYIRKEGRDDVANGAFMRYELQHNMGNLFKTTGDAVETPPDHAIPVNGYTRTSHTKAYPLQEYTFTPAPRLPDSEVENETETKNLDDILQAERATAVSDGSVDPISGKAGFAWVLTLPNKTAWIKRSAPVRSNPKYMTSYRAELAGVHDVLQYLDDNAMNDKLIDLWCDNKGVIDVLSPGGDYSLTNLNAAESDLVKSALKILKRLPKVTLRHVKGHQEDDIRYEDLPFEAQLNVDCDSEAKLCVENMTHLGSRPKPLEGSRAMLFLGTDMVTTEMEDQIQFRAHEEALRTYVMTKYEWTPEMHACVNWRAIGTAKNRLKMNRNIRTSKLMHNWLNVGKQKKKIEQVIHDGKCPCCGTEDEDQEHLYTCTHPKMREAIENGITTMEENFYKARVPKSTYIAFLDIIRRTTNSTRERKQWSCDLATLAVEKQDILGTHALLRGHHHVQWCETIRETYRARSPPPGSKKAPRDKTPFEMSVMLIEEVWNFFETIWTTRNDILHSTDSHVARAESSHLTEQLLVYRANKRSLLRYTDHHLIDFSVDEISRWDRHRKRQLYKMLEECRKQYMIELTQHNQGQYTLLDLGFSRGVAVDISEIEPD
ncbi:hypothetical protein ACHAWF_015354 [Thalassiosira exigua]